MTTRTHAAGRVAALFRYPVKSMLGETCATVEVTPLGVGGDRRYAFIDNRSGRVATAKNPRLWRGLLQCSAATGPGGVTVTLPAARPVPIAEAAAPLSELLAALLELAEGTPGGAFVDHSPVHLVTTATLDAVGLGTAEALRYRPNIVIETPPGCPPFIENDWVGRTIGFGSDGIELRATLPTPRCSVPTLQHGEASRSPHSVRYLLEHNRVEAAGFGLLPCAGLYAEVLTGGVLRAGDGVWIG